MRTVDLKATSKSVKRFINVFLKIFSLQSGLGLTYLNGDFSEKDFMSMVSIKTTALQTYIIYRAVNNCSAKYQPILKKLYFDGKIQKDVMSELHMSHDKAQRYRLQASNEFATNLVELQKERGIDDTDIKDIRVFKDQDVNFRPFIFALNSFYG